MQEFISAPYSILLFFFTIINIGYLQLSVVQRAAAINSVYRPTQNCAEYYGKSIILQKIIHLDEEKFEEITETELTIQKNNKFNFGIHTINITNDVIVVDGLRKIFCPFTQIKIFLNKALNLN